MWKLKPLFKSFRKSSLKTKLLLRFAVVILVIGGVSITSYFVLRGIITQMQIMVETTVIANNIIEPAHEIPDLIRSFYFNKQEADREKIEANMAAIKENMAILAKNIHDEDGLDCLYSLEAILMTYEELITNALDLNEKISTIRVDSTNAADVRDVSIWSTRWSGIPITMEESVRVPGLLKTPLKIDYHRITLLSCGQCGIGAAFPQCRDHCLKRYYYNCAFQYGVYCDLHYENNRDHLRVSVFGTKDRQWGIGSTAD